MPHMYNNNKDYNLWLAGIFSFAVLLTTLGTGLAYLMPFPEYAQNGKMAGIVLYSVAIAIYAFLIAERAITWKDSFPTFSLHQGAMKLLTYILHGAIICVTFYIFKPAFQAVLPQIIRLLQSFL